MTAPGSSRTVTGAGPRLVASTGRRPATLRVGQVTHYMPPHIGGIELVAEALFNAYGRAGWEVRWVASHAPVTAAPREGGRIRVGCWNGLERRLGVPWPLWGPAGLREVARLVRWADVLHVHDCLYLGSALTVLLARRWRKPVLLSQHIGFVRYRSAVLNAVEAFAYQTLGRAVLRGASHLAFCTPAAEEFVTALLGRRPSSASTIPSGIDTERFRPPTPAERAKVRQDLGLPGSRRVVLFVGRLVEKKGAVLFQEVSRRMPSTHFLMVADGPLRPAGAHNLTWLPFVPPQRMETLYWAVDCFLLPSHSEGFPLSVLEALATGVPVIVPKREAFAAVLEREGACLATDLAPAALCEAVGQLWESPGLGDALATSGRQFVARHHSLEAMGARLLTLIRDLAGKS